MAIVGAVRSAVGAVVAASRQHKKRGAGLTKTARRRRNKKQRVSSTANQVHLSPVCGDVVKASSDMTGGPCEPCLRLGECGRASAIAQIWWCESVHSPSHADARLPVAVHEEATGVDPPGDSAGVEYHALRDYRCYKGKGGKLVEEIEVEWNGGVRSWHRRDRFETPSCADHVNALVVWHWAGRTTKFSAFRRAFGGPRVRYTAGESELCGFVAIKIAFALLGWPDWVSDTLVAAFIAEGAELGVNYRAGVAWEQLCGFIVYLNRSLGKAHAHPCVRKIMQNLRHEGGNGRAGVDRLTPQVGVYLVGFCRVGVAHFVTLEVRDGDSGKFVHDESGCFALDDNEWMDTSQLVRVHRVSVA